MESTGNAQAKPGHHGQSPPVELESLSEDPTRRKEQLINRMRAMGIDIEALGLKLEVKVCEIL